MTTKKTTTTNKPGRGGRPYSINFVARALVDADFIGPTASAAKHNIHHDSINNWRKRLKTDTELQTAYNARLHNYEDDWRAEAAIAIRACLDFILRAANESNPKDPAHVRAVAGAMKMAGEVVMAKDIALAKLGRQPQIASFIEQHPELLEGEVVND